MATAYICKPVPSTWRVLFRCSEKKHYKCVVQHRFANVIFCKFSRLGSITLHSLLRTLLTLESLREFPGVRYLATGVRFDAASPTVMTVGLGLGPLTTLESGKKFKSPSSTQTS